MSNFIQSILNNIHSLRPPSCCLLCGADSQAEAFCANCRDALPWLPDSRCPRCALPTLDGGLCGGCLKKPPAFDQTHAAFAYEGDLARLITSAKFGGNWSIFPALAQLLKAHILSAPDLIIPLPLHASRLRERGFNQALEIAQPIAASLKRSINVSMLERSRDTEHQARLHHHARERNMRHAFACHANPHGLHLALVDDIMTTGATLDAAARCLKNAGAARVDVWILARTL